MSRFRFDFNSLVWQNLRRSIRQTSPLPVPMNENGTGGLSNSLWYRVLFAFLIVIQERLKRSNWLYKQIWVDTADGKGLDWWGARYGLSREPGESDSSYYLRILFLAEYRRLPPTLFTKKNLITRITGLSTDQIVVEQVFDFKYRMGDPIGTILGSRDYCFYAFRIYIPSINKKSRQNLIRILDAINIGGNVWEIWEELNPSDPSPTPEDGQVWKGARLSETLLNAESHWLVY
ncbi:hypothetical protein LEP1GSC021_4773 [Leptospira noguchii str. 1993005606]|uniref:Uncharacterized protein n=2 Tax=Leptospira noguchii TaxID=28182 RepID=M6YCS6_9LEPT|nr:hypothetical protein [Leptospira noguchii]EMM99114.1 hypothetical protein LEP1GSC035_3877 [Leptospira noguchii str. 2007001578]EMO91545.1 hypothetical protein LEP1GSC024_2575 [Leptospira noguchii str. 2001034031]EPE86544.1 hypothetical protein LEP1GSC021_4773 [Leptospira noguchii str. 1993005606]